MGKPIPNAMDSDERINQIVTQWSLLRLAHQGAPDSPRARQAMLLRYRGPIRSYVGALLREEQDADEVAQEILVRMLRGDFGSARPERGRFRDFLKVAVKNMVRTFCTRRQRRTGVHYDLEQSPEPSAEADAAEQAWQASCQREVLDAAWRGLEAFERTNEGCLYHTVLALRAEYADDDSAELAERLSQTTSRSWRADAARQLLRRARLRFAQLVVEEVAQSLDQPGPEEVEDELVDLGLASYVRPFLPADWREHGQLRECP